MENEKPLTFLDDLNQAQTNKAIEIAEKAKKMGLNPRLAVSIAYAESRLNPAVDDSEEGAIGLMQVRPNTGKMFGFSEKDLRDPDKNLEAGLMYLKQGYEKMQDPALTAAGYHAGYDHKFFEDPEKYKLGPKTRQYVQDIKDYGGFTQPQEASAEETGGEEGADQDEGMRGPPAPPSESDFLMGMAKEKFGDFSLGDAAKLSGAIAGYKAGPAIGSALQNLKDTATAKPVVPPLSAIDPSAQAVRIMQGGQGDTLGTTGRARQEGYNIETAQKAANKASMEKLTPQARQVLAEMPGMTSTESGVLYPRTETRPTAGSRPATSSIRVRGGATYVPSSLNIGNIVPKAEQPPAPLSQPAPKVPYSAPITPLAGKVADYSRAILNSPLGQKAMGALGGYGAVSQGIDAYQQARSGDYTGAALSGAGSLGNALMMIPQGRVVGTGLSTLSPAALWMLQHSRKMSPEAAQGALQRTDPMGNPIP